MSEVCDKSSRWYLVQCKPLQQARAEMNLHQQGFSLYAPSHSVQYLRRGRIDIRTEALFPGYVFIRLNEQSNWRALRATKGVSRLVAFGEHPLAVPDELVLGLQAKVSQQDAPDALFKPGDRVRITEGFFKNIEAIVKAVTPQERILVLLSVLNAQQAVQMPLAAVTMAG